MNSRIDPDALETLQAHEQQRQWRERARADWERATTSQVASVWAPVLTPEQQNQHFLDQIEQNIPF